MSATVAGAVKAHVESLGLAVPVFRDAAPNAQPMPYVTVTEALAMTPNLDGDTGDPDAPSTVRELVQLDLWQLWRDGAGRVAEDYALPHALLRGLRAARLQSVAGRRVYGVTGVSVIRLLEQSANVVHHAYTLTVHREA